MRSIGSIEDKTRAQVFCSHLFVSGIPNQAEANPDGTWQIWIHSEDQIDEAKVELDRFLADPDNPAYQEALKEAARQKLEEKKREAKAKSRHIDVRTTWSNPFAYRMGKFSLALIAVSVFVALASGLGKQESALINALRITEIFNKNQYYLTLPEIQKGQIWRLITPIFIHFGILHLLFNMLWLKDLGSMIEHVQGTKRLVFLVLLIGILSNVGQFIYAGPTFGGMSGVVYGLLGYIWIRSKYDPNSGLYLPRFIVIMMMVFFVLCFFGIFGPIANTAHTVGLLSGMALGFLTSGKVGFFKR